MYIPQAFAEQNPARLFELIDANPFGLLVSAEDGVPVATHLPFLLDRNQGEHGTLVSHAARANPHWKSLEHGTAMAVFQGPHAYISPAWYSVQNSVPTWNYVAVHAWGEMRIITDHDSLVLLLGRMVPRFELAAGTGWSVESTEAGFIERLAGAVVGLEFRIARLEGVWKLNQHHDEQRRRRVIEHLSERSRQEQAVAELMRQTLPDG